MSLESSDPVRSRIRNALSEALQTDKPSQNADSVAYNIECYLHSEYDLNTYKSRYRSLVFNIKDPKNLSLRSSILNGSLPIDKLCKMNSTELANPERAQWRRKREEKLSDSVVVKDIPTMIAKVKEIKNSEEREHERSLNRSI